MADRHTFDHVTPTTDDELYDALERSLIWIRARKQLDAVTGVDDLRRTAEPLSDDSDPAI